MMKKEEKMKREEFVQKVQEVLFWQRESLKEVLLAGMLLSFLIVEGAGGTLLLLMMYNMGTLGMLLLVGTFVLSVFLLSRFGDTPIEKIWPLIIPIIFGATMSPVILLGKLVAFVLERL